VSVTTPIQLRQSLAGRFPTLRLLSELEPEKPGPAVPTGLPQLDRLLGGGLLQGAITELVSENQSAGSGLVLGSILRQARLQWAGLIDGCDSFDPTALDFDLSRLLWVRCQNAAEALKAVDLLLRDGNLPLILLDLALNSLSQLRKTPATIWYRLQRLVEDKSTALLVLIPRAMISSAKARVQLNARFELSDLACPQSELLVKLKFTVLNQRFPAEEPACAQTG
jgi:hypothetical protein